jgi:long-chain acyl-CoA synthetase
LRLVVSAGARLPPATAAAFREAYGQPVHSFYGASECGGICYDRDGSAGERGTVGSPVEGVKVGLEPVPGLPDGEGVVTVRSPAVAERYLPERDARLAGRRFRTSDRASFRGEELVLLGRLDDLINVKGRKVDPAEVEQVISQLDGVFDVVVVGVSSRLDGSQTVRAVVACRPGLGRDEIVAFCRDRLAAHKVPRSLRIVPSLPRTSRGKIDRRAILGLGDACP